MTYRWWTETELTIWPQGYKKCRECLEVLPLTDFHKQKQTLFGVANYCKICRKSVSKQRYAETSLEKHILDRARGRAKSKDLPFNLDLCDIIIPTFCPVLGVRLERGSGDNAPSIDRVVPELGYIKGNIAIISNRANRFKSDCTIKELEALLDWLKSQA